MHMKVDEIALSYRLAHTITLIASQFTNRQPFVLITSTGPLHLFLHLFTAHGEGAVNHGQASRKMRSARMRSSLYSLVNSTCSPVRG